ncbi:helix-turn-helix domain-containing protein [Pseudomonas vancouverensis]|uniref:histidine kinase n=1 Tax=Pseudomonas vancouverensis TaxID=95300 RepID=A0A4V2X9M2_PSEVA|nr:helix-turn-helix transcriptional regulator [Pseudomonas vancouverensis]KAB0489151.1 PAS domain-containing protein [Pseudomonas vancouverensis]TDB64335.1 PAS domain S-box protein [Pseudomonas vancouverensis]
MTENSFAFRLKELLELNKLTLQVVGTALGISRTSVHKWTRGGEIDYDNLRKLADFLKVNWIWLRYGEEALRDLQGAESVELPMTDLRRRYTTEIMESEERMKLAQEGARIVTWEWNLVSDEVTYSPNVEEVYGWSVHTNEEFWSHLAQDDVLAMQAMYDRAINEGSGCEFDFRIFQPDGSLRRISSRATAVKDAVGRTVKMVGISMDNTVRMQIEDELRDSEERFRAIFELAWGALAYIGLDGGWQRVNGSVCELLGYSADELYAMTFQSLTHPDDLPKNLELLGQLMSGQIDRYVLEKRLRRNDGSYLWVRVRTSLQRRPQDGVPDHLISVFEDISAECVERERLQARIAELEARLTERA